MYTLQDGKAVRGACGLRNVLQTDTSPQLQLGWIVNRNKRVRSSLSLSLSLCSVDTRETFDFFIRRIKKINRYVEVDLRSLLSYELISINHYFHQNDSLSASVVR